MVRFPKKQDGLEFTHEDGSVLTCKPTGKSWQGVPTLAWYHVNGEQANRSINGKITYIPMQGKPEDISIPKAMPKMDEMTIKEFDRCANVENYLFERAYQIASRRYPEMNKQMDVFGMIVNSIVERLIRLSKQ
jgi:hypothetical protein